ncbi:MAG TPA: hypothetical protein VFD59_16545 [Nocardioidaceae bacterium]|nr:hypothetical protein [Nocardioidaceae bacterium]
MSTSPRPSIQPIPRPYLSLVDDAAMFPPGNAPLAEAVVGHREHSQAAYADLVGTFVVRDVTLPDLLKTLRATPFSESLPVTVIVTGGVGALEPAVRWATDADELTLQSLEFALRDEADLAHNARRLVTATDQLVDSGHLDESLPVYVEPPRLFGQPPTQSWHAALDEIAARDLRLKFRTGGENADDFPASSELATCIESALDRELAFKCTAGLHHAVRHRDSETGFEHHGFLNVLLATRASLDGSSPPHVAHLLEETDAATATELLDEVGEAGLVSARGWFTSFGSCSVHDPLHDLASLGLLAQLPMEST